MTERGLAARLRQVARRLPQRRGASRARTTRGEPVVDDSFFVLFNAHHEPLDVHACPSDATAPALARRCSTRREPLAASRTATSHAGGAGEPQVAGRSLRGAAPCRRDGRRRAARDLPRAAARPASASTTPRRSCRLPRRARHQPPLLLARTCRPRRAARTATTSSTTGGSTRELGGEAGLRAPRAPRSRAHGLGPGPRHRAQPHGDRRPRRTRWWWDVLENGPASRFAALLRRRLGPARGAGSRNRVLLPILGDHYGRVLEAGELALGRDGGALHRPLPRARAARSRRASLDDLARGRGRARRLRRAGLPRRRASRGLPLATATDRASVRAPPPRQGACCAPSSRGCCAERARRRARRSTPTVAAVNADPDALDALLERQNYRLAFWRTAARDLGYRRFFDVEHAGRPARRGARASSPTRTRSSCAGSTTAASTGCASTTSTGCAIPRGYLRAPARRPRPDAWLVVEKILEPRRAAAGRLAGRRHDRLRLPEPGRRRSSSTRRGEAPLTALYAEFTGEPRRLRRRSRASKKHQVLRDELAGDVDRLTALLVARLRASTAATATTRATSCTSALRELLACFPVYRTYVRAEAGAVERRGRAADRSGAVAAARASRPDLDGAALRLPRATCCCCACAGRLRGRARACASSS